MPVAGVVRAKWRRSLAERAVECQGKQSDERASDNQMAFHFARAAIINKLYIETSHGASSNNRRARWVVVTAATAVLRKLKRKRPRKEGNRDCH